MIHIVTRHAAVISWLNKEYGIKGTVIEHLTAQYIASCIAPSDIVAGVLPLSVVSQLCSMGVHVALVEMSNISQELRGQELTVKQMRECGAVLHRVTATVAAWP